MARSRTQISTPILTLKHNKHHVQEFYLLTGEHEYMQVPGVKRGTTQKRVGPAIIEVVKNGLTQKITKHALGSKPFWALLQNVSQVGVWALNEKRVAPLLPDEFVELSRFRGKTHAERRAIAERKRS